MFYGDNLNRLRASNNYLINSTQTVMAANDLEKLSVFIKEKRHEIDQLMSCVGLKKEKLKEIMVCYKC